MEIMKRKRRGGREHGDPIARFWSKVDQRSPSECWNWHGSLSKSGYGSFYIGRNDGHALIRAHAFSYILHAKQQVPVGLELDHLCKNTRCVNPAHLEPVTQLENMRRSDIWKQCGKYQAAKTHCPRGHLLANRNNKGFRYCGTCAADRQRERGRKISGLTGDKFHYPYNKVAHLIDEIKLAEGTQETVAARYGITRTMVSRIKSGFYKQVVSATLSWK